MIRIAEKPVFPRSLSSCKHPVLFFSSGGYYVVCSACSSVWIARDPAKDAPDPNIAQRMIGLTDKDVRVDPSADLDDISLGFDNIKRTTLPGESGPKKI